MEINKPVFIIGPYRGGTSILFRLLSESDELWSLYRESNHLWQKFSRHDDELADTIRLKASDIEEEDRAYFDNHYHYSAYANYFLGYLGRVKLLRESLSFIHGIINVLNYLWKKITLKKYRIIDKTPPNIYRVDYLAKLYPDAKFIYITRNPREHISSLMNAWSHPHKFKFPYRKYLTVDKPLNIDGYFGQIWKFLIPEDWQDYRDKSLAEVCAHQWQDAHKKALEDFALMDSSRYLQIKFEDLLEDSQTMLGQICEFLEIDYSSKMQKLAQKMPLVNTESKPSKEKQEKNSKKIEAVLESIAETQKQLTY